MKQFRLLPAATLMLMPGSALTLNAPPASAPVDDLAAPTARECLIQPSATIDVGSPVRGVLAEVRVDRGDWVKAGSILAQIDGRAERAAIALAKSRVAFTRRRVLRNAELVRDELVSPQEVDEMETEAELAQLELQQQQTILSLRDIRSPVSGVVVDRNLSAGEFVDEQEVVTIAKIDPLYVEVVLPVQQLGSIRKADKATVRPQAPVGGTYTATVSVVDQVVDAASETFRVRLVLPNPDHRVPAGLRCEIEFDFKTDM